jgi:hypothetical protein
MTAARHKLQTKPNFKDHIHITRITAEGLRRLPGNLATVSTSSEP